MILGEKNYSTQCIELFFNGNPAPGKKVMLEFVKNGPYCETPVLMMKMDASACELRPFDLIKKVDFEIGGTEIDRIYDFNFDVLFKLYNLEHEVINLGDNRICHCIPLPFDIFHNNNIFPVGLIFWN